MSDRLLAVFGISRYFVKLKSKYYRALRRERTRRELKNVPLYPTSVVTNFTNLRTFDVYFNEDLGSLPSGVDPVVLSGE